MFKLSRVKGGNVGYIKKLNFVKGKGTPPVMMISNEQLQEEDQEFKNSIVGTGTKKKFKKSIKPLLFKM